jgi:hypothetical protein
LRIGSYLAAHGRDRSVSSGGTATGGRATPAAGAAIGGVADLSRKGGHLPFDFFRAALRAVNGQLLVPTPEENLETSPTFPASEFKNRHGLISDRWDRVRFEPAGALSPNHCGRRLEETAENVKDDDGG